MASPEYTSVIECTVELTNDFSDNLPQIVDLLHAKHLISPSVKAEALQPFLPAYARASKLVTVLSNRVQVQPEALEEIVELLDPRYYSLSLAALKTRYKKHSGKDLPIPVVKPTPPPNSLPPLQSYYQAHELPRSPHPSPQSYTQLSSPQGIINGADQFMNMQSPVLPSTAYYTATQFQHPEANSYGNTSHIPQFNGHSNYPPSPGPQSPVYSPGPRSGSSWVHTGGDTYPTSLNNEHPINSDPSGNCKVGMDRTPEPEDLLWFEHEGKSVRVIPRVAADWEEIALCLGIERYILRTIKRDHGTSCEDACTNMFQRWLGGEGKGPRTWRTIVCALEDIKDNETAVAIKEVLGE